MTLSRYSYIAAALLCSCVLVALNSLRIAWKGSITTETNKKSTKGSLLQEFLAVTRKHQVAVAVTTVPQNVPAGETALPPRRRRCAINLYGLPRAFKSLVLPSLKMNVIPINPSCDYFVHFYNKTHEAAGRSGAGGLINPDEILQLSEAVHEINPHAVVRYQAQDEADFFRRRASELKKLKTRPYYKPKEFNFNTTLNIMKMWNSIQGAWDLMEEYSASSSNNNPSQSHDDAGGGGWEYDRVAMLRADVLFATPLDIWEIDNNFEDVNNRVAVIPGFATWPVNDRMIYGPQRAVREWAARRFELMDEHVNWTKHSKRFHGFGVHSEVFVAHRVIPNIKKMGYKVWEHDKLCFMRARPDETIWLNDCDAGKDPNIALKAFGGQDCAKAVEKALNRTCVPGTRTWIESTKTVTLLCKEER